MGYVAVHCQHITPAQIRIVRVACQHFVRDFNESWLAVHLLSRIGNIVPCSLVGCRMQRAMLCVLIVRQNDVLRLYLCCLTKLSRTPTNHATPTHPPLPFTHIHIPPTICRRRRSTRQ
jgi:hypothetical protein